MKLFIQDRGTDQTASGSCVVAAMDGQVIQRPVGSLNIWAIGQGFEGSASDWTEYVVWLVGFFALIWSSSGRGTLWLCQTQTFQRMVRQRQSRKTSQRIHRSRRRKVRRPKRRDETALTKKLRSCFTFTSFTRRVSKKCGSPKCGFTYPGSSTQTYRLRGKMSQAHISLVS
eukprot:s2948_g6.t1